MVEENSQNDFSQLMDEGPELFVADLEDPAIADAGVVRQMASKFVRSKTAGLDTDTVKEFERVWLSRVEQVRREEQKNRKQRIAKEAKVASDEQDNAPDESLFM
jgi:hypothetical protein